MRKQSQTSQIPQTIESLKMQTMSLPVDYANMDYGSLMNWVNELTDYGAAISELGQQVEDFAGVQQGVVEQRRMDYEQAGINISSGTKYFNLVKAQAFPQPGVPAPPQGGLLDAVPGEMPLEQPAPEMAANGLPLFGSGADLQSWLEGQDPLQAIDVLTAMVGVEPVIDNEENRDLVEPREIIKGGIQRFYPLLEEEEHELDEQEKFKREIERSRIAMEIFDILPNSAKQEENEAERVIDAPFEQVEASAFVKDIDQRIRKLAELGAAMDAPKTFNIKTAQAKTVENVIMYGPGEKRIDPFLRQPVSDWSVVERNKGFGLVVDDVWNVDWEAVWRGTIMDKYSRPYRDNDGNWVGGYIQKRFEVDKWRPEETNMQLKPGQLRKPRLPEQGVIEARLEHMRATEGESRGYGPESSGDPFNWQKSEFTKIAANDLKKKVT